jgi:hypothetical protein
LQKYKAIGPKKEEKSAKGTYYKTKNLTPALKKV